MSARARVSGAMAMRFLTGIAPIVVGENKSWLIAALPLLRPTPGNPAGRDGIG